MSTLSLPLAAQNCYVRLDDGDASGYTPSAGQLAELEAAACRLIDSLPSAFRDSFRVYDFGFYLHNETQQGGYPEAFQWAVDTVQGWFEPLLFAIWQAYKPFRTKITIFATLQGQL